MCANGVDLGWSCRLCGKPLLSCRDDGPSISWHMNPDDALACRVEGSVSDDRPGTAGLDWIVSADGYRLVVEGGVIIGLAYDEWPWPWGDPRYGLYETVWTGVTDGREVWVSQDYRTTS